MNSILNFIVNINNSLFWGVPALVLLFIVGLILSLGTQFVQFRKFGTILKDTLGTLGKSKNDQNGTISQFAAVSSSLAATVGMGNIVGVASAIVLGGPGAVFWMIVAAFLGMIMKYFEVALCIFYREKNENGEYYGGPALYMSKGLNFKPIGTFITAMTVIACVASAMIQTNVLVANLGKTLKLDYLSPYILTAIVVVIIGAVVLGGIVRLGKVTEIIVPLMAMIYLAAGIVVLISNFQNIPGAIQIVFKGAFSPISVAGGAIGYGVINAARYGFARGFFSNGGGQAIYCIPHAPAKVNNPIEQSMWAITEVFIDVVICVMTALVILSSGIVFEGANAALLVSSAFGQTFSILELIIGISIILFTFTTVIGFAYMAESQLNTMMNTKNVKIFRYIFLVLTYFGSVTALNALWDISDFIFGLIMFVNLPILLYLSPKVFKMSSEHFNKMKKAA